MDGELSELLDKAARTIDLRRMPRLLVAVYTSEGGDAQDINRICQILAHHFADELLTDVNFWGPAYTDELFKNQVRQRVVDFVDRKFKELVARP